MIADSWRKKYRELLVGILSWLLIIACAASDSKKDSSQIIAPNEDILRVGVSTNAPPLAFKQGQKIVGLEAEFARAFAKYLNRSLHFIELDWEDQIPALLENRTDIIMSGMTITALRKVRIAFANSYFRSGQMALIRSEDAGRFITGFYSVTKSSAIGIVKNTTGEFFVREHFGFVKKKEFTSSQKAVEALIDGKIDMLIHDAPIILYLSSENETRGVVPLYSLLTEEYLAWGMRKTDIELLQSANKFLKQLQVEGKLKPMLKRWIPFVN
jgi:polar amino acid transport system substrate-binding protein